ncbi:MAG: Gfo/Idh/MocA family oxidoreductase [Oscillospiraceae bacterium]|nr:Gfo/Idh/MocA family oxidoreductase [Oscillospiraceae bacterium]
MKTIRWGIAGTGGIARRFAEACKNTPGAELSAVASRTAENSQKFAEEFNIPNAFGSYEEMAKSDLIDIAYIATPHGCHAGNAILYMENKKGVMSEKPITVNVREFDRMEKCAKENGAFLMEAMWGRVVPGTIKLMEIVNSGVLGKVKGIEGSFCYDMWDEPGHHAFNPVYGGGSLLDVGCYCLYFSSWYAGSEVEGISAYAEIGPSGVDVHNCYMIKYKSGCIAQMSSAMLLNKPGGAGYIYGEKGYVKCERFYAPERIEVHIEGKETEFIETPFAGNGFEEQIAEASGCVREGLKESPVLTLEKSRFILKQMDEIRRIVGVKYPQDN